MLRWRPSSSGTRGRALRAGLVALLCALSACDERTSKPSAPTRIITGEWAGLPERVRDDLARGVNLAHWFTHRDDTSLRPGWPDAADFRQMHDLGLRHVRVLLDPDWLRMNAAHPRYLEAGVGLALDAGLLVVLAMQPDSASKLRMEKDAAPLEELAGLWTQLARTYATVPVDRLVFEVLNEPEIEDIGRALQVQQRLIDAVRVLSPDRVVVVGGAHFSDIADLTAMRPLARRGIVYSFHFYEPHNFTHQGATWGWPMWRVLHDLPYPSSPQALAPVLPGLAEVAREHAAWYGQQQWNRDRLAGFVDQAAAWSRQHQVPVWCSEFGVLRESAPPVSRRAWLADAHSLFEERGIAWSYFDWWGKFGLVTGPAGARVVDQDAVTGLGLAPATTATP